SNFFSLYPEVYDNNNANNLLNGNGYEELTSYLEGHPEELKELLILSIPENMHSVQGISIPDWGWVDYLIGKDGVLKIAVTDFRDTVEWYEKEIKRLKKNNDIQAAARLERQLKEYRRGENDGLRPNQLIEFLVRNNVLPKYGFPVDTVELYQTSGEHNVKTRKNLQMIRDLQLAIGEYAPGSQVVADGWLYTSRYIRKLPNSRGHDWEEVYIAKCENCQTWNYSRSAPEKTGEKCVSCQEPLKKWQRAIEPRKGFAADSNVKEVPIKKPEKLFRSDDYYIGDPQRHVTYKQTFELSNGLKLQTETSTNDSLMVMCNEQFFVCDKCGFAVSVKLTKESDEKGGPSRARNYEKKHNNAWGRECTNNKLYPRKLCHVFKTDVIKIIFGATNADDDSVMLSVMYALLEAMSDVLDIERNDIKGCLHKIRYQHHLINAVILYDAVAGGAGHVRRLATNDGKVFQKVVTKAINITENCNCDPSCYSCLRNYYNQAVHERLNRHAAAHFLKLFQGNMSACDNENF
ncbi:MAG: DUF1998 domain-containing protein, partial [Selenomonadaceae bacterium]|nr:DUF1998 domain-containing protein [Selenomonadaceae bacterium]